MIDLVLTAAAEVAVLAVACAVLVGAAARWDRMQDARDELADRRARRPRQTHWQ